jgi:asparagine synthase (glutamine-hydrolysing)
MTESLHHRGPDGDGYYIQGNIGLGHRRLAIIDLTTGDQPLFNDDKSIAIVLNGEIYNYIEIKSELQSMGHKFHTSSDTEVIIRAYEQWGFDCQSRFNGMWAFALWDESRKQLFISRDRLGEKPLYYGVFEGSLLFGSEIKAILASGCRAEANIEVTQLYLSLGYVPAPYSYYKNIMKLKAGNFLVVKDGTIKEKQYWDIPVLHEREMLTDKKVVHDRFEELFYDSVRLRMRSDVPFGAFLSGGLDSASVVAAMSSISTKPIETFTIGFENKEFDERKLANLVARSFHSKHSEFVVEPASFDESLEKVLYHYDEPFGDSSAIPTGYVSSVAARHVKMVLTGDGGDEVLSGYNSYQVEKFAQQYQSLPSVLQDFLPNMLSPIKKVFSGGLRYKLNRLERVLSYARHPYKSRLIYKSSWAEPAAIQRMTAGMGTQINLSDFIDDFNQKYPAIDPFYKLSLFHHKVLLPDDFLVKVDRMSMASSLEARVPFLDHRLVEFMLQVSKKVKMHGYTRKSVLRNTVGKKLPKAIMDGSKKGFTVPLREWFKDKAFDSKLESIFSTDYGLEKSTVKAIIDNHRTGKQDMSYFIWMLFVLQGWNLKNDLRIDSKLNVDHLEA